MRVITFMFCALMLISQVWANAITAVEYSWDIPAPPGSGVPLSVIPGSQISFTRNLSVSALSPGMHRLFLRAYDDSAGWGVAHGNWLYRFPPAAHVDSTITALEFWFDSGQHTLQEVVGNAEFTWMNGVPLNELAPGFHMLNVRARTAAGVWGAPEQERVFALSPALEFGRSVAEFEAWFDGGPHWLFDVADATQVQLIRNLPVAELEPGMHALYIRCRDQMGNWSGAHSRQLMAFPRINTNPSYLAGAEWWINEDPGAGNGLPLLPSDGVWDELNEQAYVHIQDVPSGFHRVGVRVRDDAGLWSGVEIDSFEVGPMLVIQASGSNIVLHWSETPGITDFEVWRSTQIDGGFNQIGAVSAQAYTDFNVIASLPQAYYHVKYVPNARTLSPFRMPARTSATQ